MTRYGAVPRREETHHVYIRDSQTMVAAFEYWIDQASTTRLPGESLAVENEIQQCTAPARQKAHFAACGAALMLSAFPLLLDIPDSVLNR